MRGQVNSEDMAKYYDVETSTLRDRDWRRESDSALPISDIMDE